MKEPKNMNVVELKALVYDIIASKQRLDRDLMQINQLIIIKNKEEEETLQKQEKPVENPKIEEK